jgi:hypothetical protein
MMASFEFSTIAARSLESASACARLVRLARRRDHQQDVPGVKVGQADVDRDLSSVLLSSDQLQIQAHGPAPGICEILFLVLRVNLPEILRHQRLNGLADQVVTVIKVKSDCISGRVSPDGDHPNRAN